MEDRSQDNYSHVLKFTGVFGGVQGLNVLVGLVRNKFVALLLGPDGMGLVSLFNTTVQLISQATHLGISLSAVRHIAEYYDAGDIEKAAHYVKVVRSWCLLTALLGMLVCVVLGPFLSNTTFSWGDHTLHFVLLAPAIGMIAITGGETAILKGQRQLGALVLVQIVAALSSLVIAIPIYYFSWQAGIVPVIVLMAFVTMCATLWFSLHIFPLKLTGSRGILGEGMGMIRLGVAFTLAGIVGSGAEMFIRSFLNITGSLDVVGLYNAGYMITITYAGLVFAAMESDFFPRLSAVNQDIEATNLMVNKQTEVSVLTIAPLLTSLIIFLPVLIPLLLSDLFLPIVGMTQVAVLAMFFKAMTLPVAYITLARGLSITYFVLESAYYVALVVLVMLGYRHWGIWGTGLAITLAHLVEFLIINGYAHCRYQYKQSSTAVKYGAVHLLIGLMAYILTMTVDEVPYWLLGVLLIVVSLSFSLWILNQKRKSSSTSTKL